MDDLLAALSEIERSVRESTVLSARWFADQVEASRSDSDQMAMWTSSTVIDDNVQAPVFDTKVFSWLHRGTPGVYEFPIGHAGLMHTYGYLLSTVQTPYGLKRDRWLTTDLASTFGLDPTFFHPTASSEPLMNRVASATIPILMKPLDSGAALAFDEVIDSQRRMRTVYVTNPALGSTAVVYGLMSGDQAQIVSAFPVQPLTEEFASGRVAERTRYRFNFSPPDAQPGSEFDGTTEVLTPFG